ncbi:MAG: T9SS type A sorting domain-containing protein [Bacteroidota bacterium]
MRKLLLLSFIYSLISLSASAWTQVGASGLGGTVRALTTYNGQLIAGGDFTTPNRVAKFNGSSWVSLGSGLGTASSDKVNALVVHGGKLYAAGVFSSTGGGTAVTNVAVYNSATDSWSAVGTTLVGEIKCLYSDGTYLWAGGTFSGKIASLNVSSNTWTQKTSLTQGVVNDICLYNGTYYVAVSSNPNLTCLSKLDGSTLTSVAPSSLGAFQYPAYALATYNNKLYVGGKLQYLSNYGVVAYDGSSFSVLPNPLEPNKIVYDLISDGTYLYGVGDFGSNNGYSVTINRVFKYHPNFRLSGIDNGFPANAVYCITRGSSYFACGGDFTSTGLNSTTALRVARTTDLTIGIDEPENVVIDYLIYPNPVIQSATVRFTSRQYLRNASLHIIDQQGRTLAEIPADQSASNLTYEFPIDRADLAAGIYFYYLYADDIRPAGGRFIVQ